MSFGTYVPTMGVAVGHREMFTNHSMQEQRRHGERIMRQENTNPITGEPMPMASGRSARPPSGNLKVGSFVPTSGPLDNYTIADKDVPARRPDPSKNQSASFVPGAAMVPHSSESSRSGSRLTESALGEGCLERSATPERRTPERRRTPGQVVRSNSRPKDNLYGGCLTSDSKDHPLTLPRKAGSIPHYVGSGGSGHIVQGPNGFVPAAPDDCIRDEPQASTPLGDDAVPFRRVCGVAQ